MQTGDYQHVITDQQQTRVSLPSPDLCVLTLPNTSLDQAGDWLCQLHHQDQEVRVATQLVHLALVPPTTLAIIPAQDYYVAEDGEEAVLVVRSSLQFSVCRVSKDMMELEVEFSEAREECGELICLGVIQAVPSCVLTVREVSQVTRGQWTFQISASSPPPSHLHHTTTTNTRVTLYSQQELDMINTSTTEMTTETTTMDTTTMTTVEPVNYVIGEEAKTKLRPLLRSCLNLGSGLARLAEREDLLDFIEGVNCTL